MRVRTALAAALAAAALLQQVHGAGGAAAVGATNTEVAVTGSGTYVPGLPLFPNAAMQTVEFDGSLVLSGVNATAENAGEPGAADIISGTGACIFDGASTAPENMLLGQGVGSLRCSGAGTIVNPFDGPNPTSGTFQLGCDAQYVRTGGKVNVAAFSSCNIDLIVNGPATSYQYFDATLVAECQSAATSVNPVTSFDLTCLGTLSGGQPLER